MKHMCKETYYLVNNDDEPGTVIRHWKSGDLKPNHDPEAETKEALHRFLALEKRLNATKTRN